MDTKRFELLKKSVSEFNKYREENPDVKIDLQGAYLQDANLQGANLQGANLDFTGWLQMSCKSFYAKIDEQNFLQLAYHLCRLDCEDADVKKIKKYLKKYANKASVIKRWNLPLI